MIWCYYDESGEYDAAGNLLQMTIGGCVAPLNKWRAFEIEWKSALAKEGLESFHMTDFEKWVRPFDFLLPDGSRDRDRHNRLLNNLLDIMLRHIEGLYGSYSISASPDRNPSLVKHGLALEDCIVGAVSHVLQEALTHYRQPINLVFAKQNHYSESKLKKIVWFYESLGPVRDFIKCEALANANDVPALQAADILAYEITRARRKNRPKRYPFRRLIDGAKANGIRVTFKWQDVWPAAGRR